MLMLRKLEVALSTGCTARYAIHLWRGQSSYHHHAVVMRYLHTTRLSCAVKGDKQTPSTEGTRDSVLMQVFKKKEQSKELTVGVKGSLHSHTCNHALMKQMFCNF